MATYPLSSAFEYGLATAAETATSVVLASNDAFSTLVGTRTIDSDSINFSVAGTALRYTGTIGGDFLIRATVSVELTVEGGASSGGQPAIQLLTISDGTETSITTSRQDGPIVALNDYASFSCEALVTLSNGESVDVEIANIAGTAGTEYRTRRLTISAIKVADPT